MMKNKLKLLFWILLICSIITFLITNFITFECMQYCSCRLNPVNSIINFISTIGLVVGVMGVVYYGR